MCSVMQRAKEKMAKRKRSRMIIKSRQFSLIETRKPFNKHNKICPLFMMLFVYTTT